MSSKLSIAANFEAYVEATRAMGSLSRLFSDSDTPFINSRFVERLYVAATGAEDLGRSDISFDAKHRSSFGVGIKTFIAAANQSFKMEKVAEFTRDGNAGTFEGLRSLELARRVAELRNKRVTAHANEFGIDLSSSIYHCLVRQPGCFFVLEQPYELIDVDSIQLVGGTRENESSSRSTLQFLAGNDRYSFSPAKSVLSKQFNFTSSSSELMTERFKVEISSHPMLSSLGVKFGSSIADRENQMPASELIQEVVLPLYSTRNCLVPEIPSKSGINQWNAAGRVRKFGEAYIPVPSQFRKKCEGFFPPREVPFHLALPNGKSVSAKICQDDGKALMSRHNSDLMEWLFLIIDGDLETAKLRLSQNRPYKYSDLAEIGMDAIRVKKFHGVTPSFSIELAPIGSYELFMSSPY